MVEPGEERAVSERAGDDKVKASDNQELMAGPMTKAESENMTANNARATAGDFQVPSRW